ncbi:MAG: hypothetical protein FD181_2844 [Prolixibacteraceae bacterium]|nr:MAG: hypothetical protein FD181_2844 [Prolixibacteraceae bacterium]
MTGNVFGLIDGKMRDGFYFGLTKLFDLFGAFNFFG